MKRFHVHVHVDDLAKSVAFYSKLFAAEPSRLESDYAKWMLDDPCINFAIATRGSKPGVDHMGFQTDDTEELAELKARSESADMALFDEVLVFSEREAKSEAASTSTCCATTTRGKPVGIAVAAARPFSSCC